MTPRCRTSDPGDAYGSLAIYLRGQAATNPGVSIFRSRPSNFTDQLDNCWSLSSPGLATHSYSFVFGDRPTQIIESADPHSQKEPSDNSSFHSQQFGPGMMGEAMFVVLVIIMVP